MARYLAQLDTTDVQKPPEALAIKTVHLKEKLAKLKSEMQRLVAIEKLMLAQVHETDRGKGPDRCLLQCRSLVMALVGPLAGQGRVCSPFR